MIVKKIPYPFVVVLLFLFTVAVGLVRNRTAVLWPVLHNEDGRDLFAYYLNNPDVSGVFRFYAGYVSLGPNLIGYLATRLPAPLAPYFMVAVSLFLQSTAFSLFSLRRFRFLIESDHLRLLFCLFIVLVPMGNYALSTAVMWSGWNFLLILFLLVLVPPPDKSSALYVMQLVFSCLAICSHPYSLLIVPICVVNLLRWPLTSARCYHFSLLICTGIYAVMGLHQGEYPSDVSLAVLPVALKLFMQRVIFGAFAGDVLRATWFAQGFALRIYWFAVISSALLTALVLFSRKRFSHRDWVNILILCYVIFSTVLVSVVGRAMVSNYEYYTRLWEQRYFYISQLLWFLLLSFVGNRLLVKFSWPCFLKFGVPVIFGIYLLWLNTIDHQLFNTSTQSGRQVADFLSQVYVCQRGEQRQDVLLLDRGIWSIEIKNCFVDSLPNR
ncbi:MAG: hypothetical protein ACOYYS_08055 [Chloroflexota bacterium]